mmetsp:Transcript_46260/g.108559  ORF Transcript_46260/g.108559 Transcript_46260/m.108559 type:complete len:285 (+) Transcript_46260:1591-2445(+)
MQRRGVARLPQAGAARVEDFGSVPEEDQDAGEAPRGRDEAAGPRVPGVRVHQRRAGAAGPRHQQPFALASRAALPRDARVRQLLLLLAPALARRDGRVDLLVASGGARDRVHAGEVDDWRVPAPLPAQQGLRRLWDLHCDRQGPERGRGAQGGGRRGAARGAGAPERRVRLALHHPRPHLGPVRAAQQRAQHHRVRDHDERDPARAPQPGRSDPARRAPGHAGDVELLPARAGARGLAGDLHGGQLGVSRRRRGGSGADQDPRHRHDQRAAVHARAVLRHGLVH